MSEKFLNDRIELHCGDCLAVLPTLAENSVDSCVTDPPYHLTSIVKRFGQPNSAPVKLRLTDNQSGSPFERGARGFMGKLWDGGDIAFKVETWREVFRVLKPGAHLVAFSGTRTYHRMACAIEDAGFEIRDQIQWLYGSGFPKSHNIGKNIEKISVGGKKNLKIIGTRPGLNNEDGTSGFAYGEEYVPGVSVGGKQINGEIPVYEINNEYGGWGTALKPACEPIVLARKPLSEGTVAANVLRWGTGALNIDGCRVESDGGHFRSTVNGRRGGMNEGDEREGAALGMFEPGKSFEPTNSALGRWPANVIHDGSEEVVGAFPESNSGSASGYNWDESNNDNPTHIARNIKSGVHFGDSGSAARFFYTAKADSDDRLGSKHPTVKPLDLMQYLVRLVTPKGGCVLDPFSGTGTTGEAAWREGMRAVLIEREEEYQSDIRRRMALCQSGPDERARESIKARTKDKPVDHGPLFGATEVTAHG